MSTHNIGFCGEIRKIFTGYPPLPYDLLLYSQSISQTSGYNLLCTSLYIKAYTWDFHLNCLDTSRQFKGGPTTCFHKENQKKKYCTASLNKPLMKRSPADHILKYTYIYMYIYSVYPY